MGRGICDTEMCERMAEAREKYFTKDPRPDPAMGFIQVAVLPAQVNGKLPKAVHLKLRYCPFCGTRISPGVVGVLD
jgi:hypothetical protein